MLLIKQFPRNKNHNRRKIQPMPLPKENSPIVCTWQARDLHPSLLLYVSLIYPILILKTNIPVNQDAGAS